MAIVQGDVKKGIRGAGCDRSAFWNVSAGVLATLIVSGGNPAMADVYINVNDYVIQASGTQAICMDNDVQCVHNYPNQYGELTHYLAEGNQPMVVDYVARSYNSGGANGGYYIGVSRNFSYDGQSKTYTLRCFADPGQLCTAPPNTSVMPQSVPRTLALNVVIPSEDNDASDPTYGTPVRLLNGGRSITGKTYFQVNVMDPGTCQQTMGGLVQYEVFATYLYQYPFGGDVGTQNALVLEEVEYLNLDPNSPIGHIERYYHVNGYGRVRDSVSYFNPNTGRYTPASNPVRRWVRPVSVMPAEPANACPQGSKPPNEAP